MGHDPADGQCLRQPEMDEIMFSAAILQPPFFDTKADNA